MSPAFAALGNLAYRAWCASMGNRVDGEPLAHWDDLLPCIRKAWADAAAAVSAAVKAPP